MSGQMTEYSVAQAKNNLPKLLDRALAGEEVTITRRGRPIASLVAKAAPGMSIDIEWLERVRVKPRKVGLDQPSLVELMRGEDRY
jgi:prevent-host-death family protein